MNRIYLIRHARPAAAWGGGDDDDPGLDDVGRGQAEAASATLMALPPALRPKRVVSSPLRRCRETAAPFAAAIAASVEIDDGVGEVPTPAALPHAERGPWLRRAFAGRWSDIEGDLDYEQWRRSAIAAVAARPGAAVFSHFVAINAVLSGIAGQAEVIVHRPDHASITSLELGPDGKLRLLERGREAATQVL